MKSDSPSLQRSATEQEIITALETPGCSWRDWFLVGDPPAISRWTPAGNVYGLCIEDEALWRACVDYLRAHSARSFVSSDEAVRVFQREYHANKNELGSLSQNTESVINDIKSMRTAGVIHCGYLAGEASLSTVASLFSLSSDVSNYRKIGKTEALQILTRVLHKDMAYDSEIMSARHAAELSASFLRGFEDEFATFFTNIDYSGEGRSLSKDSRAGPNWMPVTESTFDAGVIAVSGEQSACLWIEDED